MLAALPPPDDSAADVEGALLGALLEHPRSLIDVSQIVRPSDFGRPDWGRVYAVMVASMATGQLPDQIETPLALQRAKVGGELITDLMCQADGRHYRGDPVRYARRVREASLVRQARQVLLSGWEEIQTSEDPTLAAQGVALDLMMLGGDSERPSQTPETLVDQSLEALLARSEGDTQGLSTGLEDLDRLLMLEAGRLYVVAARPGMGKSAFCGHFVRCSPGARWGIVSLEMSGREWTDRLICAEGCIDMLRYSQGSVTATEVDRLAAVAERVRRWHYRIDERSGLTWPQVAAKARQWHAMGQLDALIVDYLQLLGKRDRRLSTYDHVTEVSQGAKALARDLQIPVVLLSQLNRDAEKRPDKRPVPSDLRDSGSIEQDADVILMLYRDAVYDRDADPHDAEILVRKNRGGPCGMVPARWDGQWVRFSSSGGAS